MTTDERIKFADEVWELCRNQLSEPLREQLVVMEKGAKQFDKNSKGSARLRVKPQGKLETDLWKSGCRWYEVHFGGLPRQTLVGAVFFLYSAHTDKGGAPTPCSETTRRMLQAAAVELGGSFKFDAGETGSMSLRVDYKGFPNKEEWARDLARLIELTFPRLQAITA